MPWTAADAKGHNKKADTPAKQKKWAKVANAALKTYDGDEGKAIAAANAAIDRYVEEYGNEYFEDSDDKTLEKNRMLPIMDRRFADVRPQTFDRKERTVDAVLSMGSEVKRFYGKEVLRITENAVDLTRMKAGGVPLLDHHKQDGIDSMLGRVTETWFKNRSLLGRLKFNETSQGEKALGMVERGEIAGVSIGYGVDEWRITDPEGNVIDPEKDRMRWDDNLTFTATRWKLFEASLVGVPADGVATVRNLGSGTDRLLPDDDDLARRATSITKRFGDLSVTYDFRRANSPIDDIRARMTARQAMSDRMFK